MSKKKYLFAISLCIAAVLALGGCATEKKADDTAKKAESTASQPVAAEKKEDTKKETVSLSEWNGDWNNIVSYLDDPELKASFDEVGKREGKTGDQAKAELKERRKFDYKAVKIDGNKMSFLDNFADKGGKVLGTGEYKFLKSQKVKHGNSELEWDVFEATNADAPHKYLTMMPIHGEEALTHFHMRYGNNLDELLNPDSKWYPALIKPSSTLDQLKEEITE